MTYSEAIVLGLIQGLTEFLPVSSSGHLVLAQSLLGVADSGVALELVLHAASLLAVFVYFRKRLAAMAASVISGRDPANRRLIWYVAVATVPAVIAALLLKDFFEQAFSSPRFAAGALIVTGLILLSTRLAKGPGKPLGLFGAMVMGIGQAVAILPGISRAGTTISTGMLAGVKPDEAAEFSFLLAIPAIIGALIFKVDELSAISGDLAGPYLVGALITFVASIAAVYAVLTVIKRGRFTVFGYYCIAAGLVGLYLFQ